MHKDFRTVNERDYDRAGPTYGLAFDLMQRELRVPPSLEVFAFQAETYGTPPTDLAVSLVANYTPRRDLSWPGDAPPGH